LSGKLDEVVIGLKSCGKKAFQLADACILNTEMLERLSDNLAGSTLGVDENSIDEAETVPTGDLDRSGILIINLT